MVVACSCISIHRYAKISRDYFHVDAHHTKTKYPRDKIQFLYGTSFSFYDEDRSSSTDNDVTGSLNLGMPNA